MIQAGHHVACGVSVAQQYQPTALHDGKRASLCLTVGLIEHLQLLFRIRQAQARKAKEVRVLDDLLMLGAGFGRVLVL